MPCVSLGSRRDVGSFDRVGEVTAFNANGQITNYQVTLIAPEVKALIDQAMFSPDQLG